MSFYEKPMVILMGCQNLSSGNKYTPNTEGQPNNTYEMMYTHE